MILDEIVQFKKQELIKIKNSVPEKYIDELIEKKSFPQIEKIFAENIKRKDGENLKIIAEIKKASPSKGIIREDFNYTEIARIYSDLKADAISVLTETKFFLGNLDFIKDLSSYLTIPLLRKDFIIEEYQIKESLISGASAILLICAILSSKELERYINLCTQLGLDYIAEVHDMQDLEKALSAGALVIGINNRNLKTFGVDIKTTEKLMKHIPEGKIIISESGIHTESDAVYMNDLNVDAVLIGEALMGNRDIKAKFIDIFGKVRNLNR